MAITLRQVKGSPLTIIELDANFEEIDDRVIALEGQLPVRTIEETRQDGNSLFVDYTDSTTDGPFTFEVQLTFRGEWQPNTAYNRNDMLSANGVIYIVPTAHTSDVVFDPGANSGSAEDFYAEFIVLPELQIPAGGGEGYVLTKASVDDYDMEWQNRGLPVGGSTGEVLGKVTDDDFDIAWIDVGAAGVPIVLTVSTATLDVDADSYSSRYMRCTHASGCEVTILPDDEFEFPTSTELHFRQCSANPVVIVAGTSTAATVQLNAPTGYETATEIEGAVITVKKVAANEWDVFGLLAAVSA